MNAHRLLERLAVGVFAALVILCAVQFVVLVGIDARLLLPLVPTLLLALAGADLVSGIMHFLLDSRGDANTRFWGTFIRPFRDHHVDPAEMTRHGFVHTNGHTAIAICPLLVLVMSGYREPMDSFTALQFAFLVALLVFLGLTNQFHKWAHAVHPPRPVRWLQAARLILPSHRHALHHATHRDYFCITTGWNNAWLAKTQLLQRVLGNSPETTTARDNA